MNLPPLHAAIVHVPITLVPLSVAADWVGNLAQSQTARVIARWSMLLGWIGTGAAVLFGHVDLARAMRNPAAEALYPYVLLHLKIGWIIFGVATVLAFWRLRLAMGVASGHRAYLAVASVAVLLVIFQAWYGGELVYTKGLGVAPAGQALNPPGRAEATLDRVHGALSRVPGLGTDARPPDQMVTPAKP